jgi:stage III sporulation protein AF
MQVLTEIVRNIVVILLLTTFLQLLLPSQSMQPFIKVALGLFVLFSFLNPLLQLVNGINEEEVRANVALAEKETGMNFRDRTEQQIAAMLRLVTGLDNVEVQVVLEKSGANILRETIQEIIVVLEHNTDATNQELVQPIQIQGHSDQENSEFSNKGALKEEILYTICRCFGVRENQVRVQFQ